MPQAKLFKILGDSGYGFQFVEGHWPLKITLSGKRFTKYGECFTSAKDCIEKFGRKFSRKIFIKTGHHIKAEYYKKYVFFDIEAIEHLLQDYFGILLDIRLWTGDDKQFVQLRLHYCYLDFPLTRKNAIFMTDPKIQFNNELINNRFIRNEVEVPSIMKLTRYRLQWIENLEITMNVDEFIQMKSHFAFLKKILAPKELRIYLSLVENNASEAKGTKCPADFPIEWVTDLIDISNVQVFSLHYFDSNSTANDIGLLLSEMPNLIELDLWFGKTDIERIARLVPFKDIDCHIQVKIDRQFFEEYQFRHIKSVWKIDIQDKVAVAGYIKRARYDSNPQSWTLYEHLITWLRYRWGRIQGSFASRKQK